MTTFNHDIKLNAIRNDEWVNPFNALPEELISAALEPSGLIHQDTKINGKSALELYRSFCKKRAEFQESFRLGNILVQEGIITTQQLVDALSLQQYNKLPLGQVIVSMKLCTEHDIQGALERQKAIREEVSQMEEAEANYRSVWRQLGHFLGFEKPYGKM